MAVETDNMYTLRDACHCIFIYTQDMSHTQGIYTYTNCIILGHVGVNPTSHTLNGQTHCTMIYMLSQWPAPWYWELISMRGQGAV